MKRKTYTNNMKINIAKSEFACSLAHKSREEVDNRLWLPKASAMELPFG